MEHSKQRDDQQVVTVLFITHKYQNRFDGDRRLALAHYCAVGAGQAHGLDVRCHYFDVPEESDPITNDVDLIVVTPLVTPAGSHPAPESFKSSRRPVIGLWLESAPNVVAHADMYAPYVTANVFIDTADHWKQFTKYPEKTFWVPEPKDPRVFYSDDAIERTIPVSFGGTLVSRPDRAMNIGWLLSGGVNVRVYGGLYGEDNPVSEYADVLRRSQIGLNFTSAVSFQQLKGRTGETLLCGALLMEPHCSTTAQLLEPYVHYVPFEEFFHLEEEPPHDLVIGNKKDLVEKIRHYIGPGQAEARIIARQGHERAVELFDGRLFWRRIFDIAIAGWTKKKTRKAATKTTKEQTKMKKRRKTNETANYYGQQQF